MKKLYLLLLLAISCLGSYAQTVHVQYLNPTFEGTRYKFLELGFPGNVWGGLMMNNNTYDKTYGNGDDVSIFTYGNRDLAFQTGSGNVIFFPSSGGRVGIGTPDPQAQLDVFTESSNSTIRLTSNRAGGADSYLEYKNKGSVHPNTRLVLGRWGGLSGNFSIALGDGTANPVQKFFITGNGHVGIGTPDPGVYMLAVNGDLKAKKINVTLDGWSDFVFDSDYNLRALKEVEAFIATHRHLPDVPSEAEVIENGVELGKMNSILLQKIEELTLYSIQQEKELAKKEEQYNQLSERLSKLEKLLEE